jgi:hypothetical protein
LDNLPFGLPSSTRRKTPSGVEVKLDRSPGLARDLNAHAGTLTHISVAETFA